MCFKKLGECAKITFCSITPSRSKTQTALSKWFACSNFLVDNEVVNEPIVNNMVPDSDWLLHQNDIVVKRITPTFVNYIDFEPQEIYGGNNLIIITPHSKIDAKYLAMILNDKIDELSKESSVGAVMKSISRNILEQLDIPMIDEHKRRIVGELWYKGIELKKKKNKLIELENTRINHLIKKLIQISGGKNNG